MHMTELVDRFRGVLDTRRDILECFCTYGVQLEGWLKGELLYFLASEKAHGRLYDFDREVGFGQGRRRIDIKITHDDHRLIWLELKHWLIGYQRGSRYGAGFYFGDSSAAGIKPDVEKLNLAYGRKHILILTTANPGEEWYSGVERFNRKFAPAHILPLTNPADYPAQYFLGLLSVE